MKQKIAAPVLSTLALLAKSPTIIKKLITPLLFLSVTGCTHYYYAPNAANIPLFKTKNSFKGKAAFAEGNYYTGGDIQLAYSVSPKFAVMLNSFFAAQTESVDDHYESGKGSYFEAGGGYYKAFGKHNTWIFEAYGGAGTGTENHIYSFNERAKLTIAKYFIQPSFGYSSKKNTFEFAVAGRVGQLHLQILQSNVSERSNAHSNNTVGLHNIRLHPSSFLWEPSVMIAAGWPNFKFFLQHTASDNWSNRYLYQDDQDSNIGIKFSFDGKTKN